MFHKHRLEALSDAVIAIAMTLLILELKVPVDVPHGELASASAKDGPSWVSFGITFYLTAIFWTMQHKVFDCVSDVYHDGLILTFVFLAFVTILPFSTSLWGHHLKERLAQQFYFANQCAIALALTLKLEVARSRKHLRVDKDHRQLRFRLYTMTSVMLAGFLAIPFVTPKFIWVAPFTVVFVARLWKRKLDQRWKATPLAQPA